MPWLHHDGLIREGGGMTSWADTWGVCTSQRPARTRVLMTLPSLSTSLMVGFTAPPSTAAPTCSSGLSSRALQQLHHTHERQKDSTMCHYLLPGVEAQECCTAYREELRTSRASSKHFLTSSVFTSGLAESWMATKAASWFDTCSHDNCSSTHPQLTKLWEP